MSEIDWEHLCRLSEEENMRLRILLSARPEVTREAVEAYLTKRDGYVPSLERVESHIAALSHFAPPAAPLPPICGMSEMEIGLAMREDLGQNMENWSIGGCARVAHRLAQPAPVVDPDDIPRKLAWDFHNVKRSAEIRAGITQTEFRIWPEMHETEREAWRAVAKEKANG